MPLQPSGVLVAPVVLLVASVALPASLVASLLVVAVSVLPSWVGGPARVGRLGTAASSPSIALRPAESYSPRVAPTATRSLSHQHCAVQPCPLAPLQMAQPKRIASKKSVRATRRAWPRANCESTRSESTCRTAA
eukprot:42596-Prymnesium_polylepis.4